MSITWWFRTKKSGWSLQFNNEREHCSKLGSMCCTKYNLLD